MSSVSQSTTKTRGRSRELATVAAVPAAVGLASWLVIDPIAGVDLATRSGDTTQAVGWPAVLVMSIVAALAGWACMALLRRFSTRPRRIWTVIAVAVLVVSLVGTAAGVDPASRWSLAALHVLVGGAIITVLRQTTRDQTKRD